MKTSFIKNLVIGVSLIALQYPAAAIANSITLEQAANYDAEIVQEGERNFIDFKQIGNAASNLSNTGRISQSGKDNTITAVQQRQSRSGDLNILQEGENNKMKVHDNGHQIARTTEVFQSGTMNDIDVLSGGFRGMAHVNQAGQNNKIKSTGSMHIVQATTASESSIVSNGNFIGEQEGHRQSIIFDNYGEFGGGFIGQYANSSESRAEGTTKGLGSLNIKQYGHSANAYGTSEAYAENTIVQKGKYNTALSEAGYGAEINIMQEEGSDHSMADVKVDRVGITNLLQDGVNNTAVIRTNSAFLKTTVNQLNGNNTLHLNASGSNAEAIKITQNGSASALVIQR